MEVKRVGYQYVDVFYPPASEPDASLELAGPALQEMWCSDDTIWTVGLIAVILLGICGLFLSPVLLQHQWLQEKNHRQMQRDMASRSCHVYCMPLAGATWKFFASTEFLIHRTLCWQWFPWADLLVPVVNFIISVIVGGFTLESVAPSLIIFLLFLAARICFRVWSSLQFHRRLAKRRADLYVCASATSSLISFVCDGRAHFYHNIGDVPPHVPAGPRWASFNIGVLTLYTSP